MSAAIGRWDMVLPLLSCAPIYLLIAMSSSAAGLAAASAALGRRADVVISNGFLYLIIATGGLFIPLGKVPALDAIGSVLPGQHGVRAIRQLLAGEAWGLQVVLEVVVLLGWSIIAVMLLSVQLRRARAQAIDDFA